MHFCRVYVIFFGCVELCRESVEEWGKEAHDRHASPSVRTCFFLHVVLPSSRRPEVRRAISWRGRERKRQGERRRRTWYKTGSAGEDGKERKRAKGERERGGEDWRATEAGNAEPNRAGYRCIGRWLSGIRARSTLEEFCPLLLFFSSRRSVPVRSLARL